MVTSRCGIARTALLLSALSLFACDATEADERHQAGLVPGNAKLADGIDLSIFPGRARTVDGAVVARAATPTPLLTLSGMAGEARFRLANVQPGSRLTPPPSSSQTLGPTTLELTYEVPEEGLRIQVEPPGTGPLRLAVVSDVHNNLATFGRFCEQVKAWRPQMVLCMGDLTRKGTREQFDEIFGHLSEVEVPFYTTIGNHELMGEAAERFNEEIGPGSVAFDVGGVRIVLADTAGAAFAPDAYDWLSRTLWPRGAGPALVFAHIPPLEPWGTRNHGFSNRDDALRFVQVLSQGRTTHFFAGHIHDWAQYSLGGVPAIISGGGGGELEAFGAGAHWLKLEVDPVSGTPVKATRVGLD